MMYTIDDIIHHTGIPADKARELCHLLSMEGYLISDEDTGKYRLTKDKDLLDSLKTLWDQCKEEHKFEQMSRKIEDILQFGKPLALSEKGPDFWVKDIGVPGLNIIFGNLKELPGSTTDEKDAPRVPGLPRGHCLLIKGAPGTGKTTLGMQIALYLKKYRARFLTFEEDLKQLLNDFHGYLHPDDRSDRKPPRDKDGNTGMGWRKDDIIAVTRSLIKIRTPQAWKKADLVVEELIALLDRELPHFVVIDSLSRFRDLGGDENARHVLRRLIRSLKARRITAIFTAEDRGEENPFEEYEVDGVIDLKWFGDMLTLTVKKLRSIKAYRGPHSAAMISVDDLDPVKNPQQYLISEEKVRQVEKEKKEKKQEERNREEEKREKEEEKVGDEDSTKKIEPEDKVIPYLTVGFNVFPDISVYKDIKEEAPENISEEGEKDTKKKEGKEEENGRKKENVIDTGTPGLNKLLKVSEEEKGFKRGETILVVGSAGAGKTLLSLNFAFEGYREKEEEKVGKSGGVKSFLKENCMWLNFEGKIETLKFAIGGFEDTYAKGRRKMIESAIKEKKPEDVKSDETPTNHGKFIYIEFLPINLDLNKIVYTLEALHKVYGIDRLVIDSITELERAKGGGQPAVKVFLAGLIQFLRERQITTVFVCRSDAFFRSIDKIEEQVSSLVDLIICIRNFDIHNQIQKGIYIQKARGRFHNSKIMRMVIDSKKGIDIEDSGWDLENLLAGDSSSIVSPQIFFKLFYENPAEKIVNERIIDDFDRLRYPAPDPKFTLVKKPSIYTEFWSFKGQFSAGHANTRVLSIPDYVINAFRDNDRLAEVDKYVKSEVLQNIELEEYLVASYKKKPDFQSPYLSFSLKENAPGLSNRIIDAVPSYHDYGVMVVRKPEINEETNKELITFKEELESQWSNFDPGEDSKWKDSTYKWETLLKRIEEINSIENVKKGKVIPFAFPPLDMKSEFVAFFMELLWSFGGDIYKFNVLPDQDKKGNKFTDQIKESVFTEFLDFYQTEKIPLVEALSTETLPEGEETEKTEKTRGIREILNDFENRFEAYGLRAREIDIRSFKKWIAKEIKEEKSGNLEEPSVLKLDDKPFEETIKLMMRLVYRAGVDNPIDGEFRHRAILSRNWYSRIFLLKLEECKECIAIFDDCTHMTHEFQDKCMENFMETLKLKEKSYKLLPLPLAKIKVENEKANSHPFEYYRSVTCLTLWSLVMLKNALSPEIGGNFIESMKAPEYYNDRLTKRFGMPVTYVETKKKKFQQYDPISYKIVGKNFDNSQKYNITKKKIQDNKDLPVIDFSFVHGEFLEFCQIKDVHPLVYINGQRKQFEDNIHKTIFFHKIRQSRTAFYQLEEALHYQLKQLFIKDPNLREERIYRGEKNSQGDPHPIDCVIELCKKEKENSFRVEELNTQKDKIKSLEKELKTPLDKIESLEKELKIHLDKIKCLDEEWKTHLAKIKQEFRLHVVFELLTYFYHEHERGV